MATATKTKPKAPTAELAELDAAVTAARAERDRLRLEAREHEAQLAALDTALNDIAQEDASQFDGGQPKPNTEAAKLHAKLQEIRAAESRWPALILGVEEKVKAAEREATGYRAEHAVELATVEFSGGEDDLDELDGLAEQMLGVLARIRNREVRLIALTNATPGRINAHDVKVDARLSDLMRLLADHASFCPPRSRSLTPLTGEMPPTRRAADGGYIRGGYADENYGEQPPEIEAQR